MLIKYDSLLDFTRNILSKVNLDNFSLESVSVGLCETSLRGVDSHGIRLLPHYVNSAIHGRKNPRPQYSFKKNFPSVGHLEADNAFGHAAGMKAIDHAVEIAEKQGVGVVGVSNSSHPGAMASMALRAARKGYMSFAFTHADSLVLSYNGTRPYFGTNPICFAVPRAEEDPYCLDMASSIIPWNRLMIHRNNNTPLPDGVAADNMGRVTNNSKTASCLMPTGSYKGYGISSMVEILCGIYTGMAFGRSIPSMFGAPINEPRHLGQFYMVMRTDGIISTDYFIEKMQEMTDQVRSEPSVAGEDVMLPGDKEVRESEKRMKKGIPIDDHTAQALYELGIEYSIDFYSSCHSF